MPEKKKKYVRVCPNCFSEKLNSHLGLTGEGYKCNNCGFDNFYPLEIDEDSLKKVREELKKRKASKKPRAKKKSK